MPISKDHDGMEIPEGIFRAEELIYRFRCMPDRVEEDLIQDADNVQEIVKAIQDYKEYFEERLGTEDAANDRFEALLGEAAKLQPGITQRFNEAALAAQLEQEEDDGELDSRRIRDILGDDDYAGDEESTEVARQFQDLHLNDVGRILGDNDHEVYAEPGSIQLRNQDLTPENLARILGDNDYILEGDEIRPLDEDLHPEDLGRILGDNDYVLNSDNGVREGNGELRPDDVRRILGDNDYDLDEEGGRQEYGELRPEDLRHILGDGDYDLDDDVGGRQHNGELTVEDIERILGDDDFEN